MALKKIDLNSDVGESFGRYMLGLDEEVIPLISSANIACGFHAGDPSVMKRTIDIAAESGIAVGAHPGFPDLLGFGRRKLDASLDEIKDYVTYQIGALQAFATSRGLRLQHVKPHGALYTMAVADTTIWDAVAQAVAAVDSGLILVVLGGRNRREIQDIGARYGIRIGFEFFGDRAYNADGSLVSRKQPGAVIHDPQAVADQVLRMVQQSRVRCLNGTQIEMTADTICVHGDNPAALKLIKKIRRTLMDEGIEIAPLGRYL